MSLIERSFERCEPVPLRRVDMIDFEGGGLLRFTVLA